MCSYSLHIGLVLSSTFSSTFIRSINCFSLHHRHHNLQKKSLLSITHHQDHQHRHLHPIKNINKAISPEAYQCLLLHRLAHLIIRRKTHNKQRILLQIMKSHTPHILRCHHNSNNNSIFPLIIFSTRDFQGMYELPVGTDLSRPSRQSIAEKDVINRSLQAL